MEQGGAERVGDAQQAKWRMHDYRTTKPFPRRNQRRGRPQSQTRPQCQTWQPPCAVPCAPTPHPRPCAPLTSDPHEVLALGGRHHAHGCTRGRHARQLRAQPASKVYVFGGRGRGGGPQLGTYRMRAGMESGRGGRGVWARQDRGRRSMLGRVGITPPVRAAAALYYLYAHQSQALSHTHTVMHRNTTHW